MDAVLKVVGIRTSEHIKLGAVDSLRRKSSEASATSTVTCSTPLTDSALSDEVEEAFEAIEYVDTSEDCVHS